MAMITTLNPKFSAILAALGIIGFLGEIAYGNTGVASFVLGYTSTLPLIILIWRTMRKNWAVYKKFYSMGFYKRDRKIVVKSWRLTWWVLPYAIAVYSILEVLILLNPIFGSLYSFLYGAVFATFGYTALQSPKYYKDIKKKKK